MADPRIKGRGAAPLLRALAIAALVSAACGGAAPAGPGAAAKPDVRIGSFNFTESVVLAELYGLVLEGNGYKFEHRQRLGSREVVFPALEKGDINFVPEYLATALGHVTQESVSVGDAQTAHRQLQEAVRRRSLLVLDFAPAIDTNAFVVTRTTAQRHSLRTMSDLAKVSTQLTLGGPPECPQRQFCLVGLKRTYGIDFKEFKPLDAGGPLTVQAVESGQVDVGLLFSTDANITAKGFVLLEDDKKLQNADNVAPLVRDDLASKGGDEFKRLVNGVSAKLTTEELTKLNKLVSIDKREAKDVAREWLKGQGLLR
jgi:osmoprotectant transport system substrate-binding protein